MKRLDKFMNDALVAYYNNRDPFGVDGDFITAPEISQLFGEIIGIWVVQQWIKMGKPSHYNLIEIGAGRGTLMADLLRGTRHISEFMDATNVHIIETSETLIEKQQSLLKNHTISWHNHLSDITTGIPAIIIMNEFFDALPIRQFKYDKGQWMEHYIHDDKSVWVNIDNPPFKSTLPPPSQDDIYEYSQMQADYASLLSGFSGAKLIIDYGYTKSDYGDSLQALYKHKPCNINENIGNADITSHIDFEWLSTFFNNIRITNQRNFLKENGIDIRYKILNNTNLESGYKRLIDLDQMGDLFKVLEIAA
jgi:NADH dehydrogenase [ubiquinone] 1 alpha subcomplex assembly factor 7